LNKKCYNYDELALQEKKINEILLYV